MTDYKSLSVQELTKRLDDDQLAVTELLRRQNMGVLNRIYVGPRKGANDLGVTAICLIARDFDLILQVGIAGRQHTISEDVARQFIDACPVALATLRLMMQLKGFSDAAIQRRYQERQSPLSIETVVQNGEYLIRFHPLDCVQWTLGPESCDLLCNALQSQRNA